MTPSDVSVAEGDTLAKAAAVMIRARLLAVPVAEQGGRPKGVVRRADILAAVAQGTSPSEARAGDFATAVVAIGVDESPDDTLALMMEHGSEQLLVVDGERPVGFVSRLDIEAYLRMLGAPDQVDPISEGSFFGNAGEHSLRRHLQFLFSRLDVNCVMDVGASVGSFAKLLRSFGYSGWLFSFEPVPSAFAQLEEAASQDERWRAFNLALGSREEVRSIKIAQGSVFSSFLEPSDYSRDLFPQWSPVMNEEAVTVRTLDSIAPECLDGISDPRVFLKADTQGWDLEVLRGATTTLADVVATQLEISVKPLYESMPGYREAIEYLEDRGYELTGLFPVVRDHWLRLVELDCVMIKIG
jgi:FkbM family methyltransferase